MSTRSSYILTVDTTPSFMKKKHELALGVVAALFFALLAVAFYVWQFPKAIYLGPGFEERLKEARQAQEISVLVFLILAYLIMLNRCQIARLVAKLPHLMDVIILFIIFVEAISHGFNLPIPHSHAWLDLLIPYFSTTRGGQWFLNNTRMGKLVTKMVQNHNHSHWPNWAVKLLYYINMPFQAFWYYWAKKKTRSD